MKFDISLKDLLGARPQRLFQYVCGSGIDTLTPAAWPALEFRADLFGQLENGGWLHAEVQAEPVAEMPWRMLGYLWLAWYNHGVTSLTQIVFVLRGKAASMTEGLTLSTPELRYRFKVVVFEEIDAEVLAGGTPEEGLLSLLCRGGTEPLRVREVLRQCLDAPPDRRSELLYHLQVLSGLRSGLAETIRKEQANMPLTVDLSENVFWREANEDGVKKGREEGREEGRRSLLRNLLADRFGALPGSVDQRLASASPEQIDRWARRLLTAATLEDVIG